jgi:pyruvate formate lyase activating enzyme
VSLDRRRLLTIAACGACGAVLGSGRGSAGPAVVQPGRRIDPDELPAREASWYRKLEGLKVECQLCPQGCVVADMERGTCGVRENRGGTYFTLVHGVVCTVHADPIEKKPFFHVLPGERALSFAAPGCNVECKFCQNWEISQFRPEQVASVYVPPESLVEFARREGTHLTASTYSEPVVFWEYVRDAAKAARAAGLRPTVVSNGYIRPEPLAEVLPHLTAMKVDLKAFTEEFYERQVRGRLQPVLEALKVIRGSGVWLEIVVLLIPTLNDSPREIEAMSAWIVEHLGRDVPIHFTRFHPTYRLTNLPPTPVETLERAGRIATDAGLRFVYLGNLPGHPKESTYCPGCSVPLIRRMGFQVLENRLAGGACPDCGRSIPGVWS